MKVTSKNVDTLQEALSKAPEEVILKLNGYFQTNASVTSLHDLHLLSMRDSIFLDFFLNCILYGKSAQFSNSHTACILNMAERLMENVKQGMDMETNLEALKGMTRELLANDPEQERIAFSLSQCKSVFEEFLKLLFQSYGLYLYVFTKEQEDKITSEERTVEHLPILPPLSQATHEPKWLAEKQREEEAIREAEEHKKMQAAELERRRIEDSETAERLKDIELKEACESLTPETLQLVAEKVIADHVGPLCTEIRNRILQDQRMIIKEAGLQLV